MTAPDVHAEDLIASYAAALRAVDRVADRHTLRPAREFGVMVGTIEAWHQLDARTQAELSSHIRAFVSWLLLTGRAAATTDYLALAQPQLSNLTIRFFPDLWDRFAAAAAQAGADQIEARRQLQTLATICALDGSPITGIVDGDRSLTVGVEAYLTAPAPDTKQATDRRRHAGVLAATLNVLGIDLEAVNALGALEPLYPATTRTRMRRTRIDWTEIPDPYAHSVRRYLDQLAVSHQSSSVADTSVTLRDFGRWLGTNTDIDTVADLRRQHIESYKQWLHTRPSRTGDGLVDSTIGKRLAGLRAFFERITEWRWDEAPPRPLVFSGDLPTRPRPLPRFLEDGDAAKLLRAARQHPDPLVGLVVELLARTGMRRGELVDLTTDAITQIGDAYWLRIPVGKLRTDRYIPLHPQLKDLLDDWITARPECVTTNRILVENGRPVSYHRIGHIVTAAARAAGIDHVSPHQLRHTLATQAINRGMSLEAIAALLGHTSMTMTMVYARIADRTVAEEYFAVSEKVEALYDQPALPADAEGANMRNLRAEVNQRLLGNGHCTRPAQLDCQFETICETCTYFATTVDFLPTLRRQQADATERNDNTKAQILGRLIGNLDEAG